MPALAPPFITVVSGVPRSGTSMLMQMLGAGGLPLLTDGARPPDAFNPLGYFEYEPAKRLARDASWLPAALGKAVKIVHALLAALPAEHDYRVVLVRRDLRQVVASQQAMLGAAPTGADALPEPRLVEIFRSQLEAVERWAEERSNVRLLRVEHRDVMRDAPAIARRLCEFLELELDSADMAAVVTPGLFRQRG